MARKNGLVSSGDASSAQKFGIVCGKCAWVRCQRQSACRQAAAGEAFLPAGLVHNKKRVRLDPRAEPVQRHRSDMTMINLDPFDLALLAALQTDGRSTHQQLAERIHLSPSQIGRRLARLEADGVITGYRVVLSPPSLGLGVLVFTSVKLAHHGDTIVERFREDILLLEEVQECYSVAGEADYLLRIMVPDLPTLAEFTMKKLMRVPGVESVRSNIVLTALKRDGPLPLSHLR